MFRFQLTETSEKTVEINVLSDFTNLIESLCGKRITIISPTAKDEKDLGFDEIIEDLPPGRVIAFQFKRPFLMKSRPDYVRFVINTRQLQNLLKNFYPNEAYYVFAPYPQSRDIAINRRTLLHGTKAVDVYDIPNGQKITQRTRTVRCHRLDGGSMEITDPFVYQPIEKVRSLDDLANKLIKKQIGFKVPLSEKRKKKIKLEKIRVRKLFYIHLSSE